MSEYPILFSAPMVRAIREGRKTMTRRVIKPQPQPFQSNDRPGRWWWFNIHRPGWPQGRIHEQMLEAEIARFCPYGGVGDTLWVRETWAARKLQAGYWAEYKADNNNARIPDVADYHDHAARTATIDTWRPSIFMPRHLSRITLRVTGRRIERVQAITTHDAIAEGVDYDTSKVGGEPISRFAQLWNSINADRGFAFEANPWVWVVSFVREEGGQ